ncbi:unnamed protein product [Chironomus riparius]|uniref:Single domain-containing protein n=1 Tax=Chironomus riparius TaxID=315576 RepID=A0A9N9RTA6_9DIPT|nr:unnamed protein product [Chironomus riparius]
MTKSVYFCLLLISLCIFESDAAAWFNRNTKIVTKCEGSNCQKYCDIDNRLILVGTTLKTDQCEQITCDADFSSSYYSCGIAVDKNGCTLTPDYSFKYPECCNKMKCVT